MKSLILVLPVALFGYVTPLAAAPTRYGDFLPAPEGVATSAFALAVVEARMDDGALDSLCAIAQREVLEATTDWHVALVGGVCAWRGGDLIEAVGHLLRATRDEGSGYQPAMALAALYAGDGSTPESVGWLRRAHRKMNAEAFKLWVHSPWFDRIRYTSLFREMLHDLAPKAREAASTHAADAASTADDASSATVSPLRLGTTTGEDLRSDALNPETGQGMQDDEPLRAPSLLDNPGR